MTIEATQYAHVDSLEDIDKDAGILISFKERVENESAVFKHHCTWDGCTRSFKKPAYLVEHLLIHKDERPYICSDCDGKFRRKQHLLRHIELVHSSETTQSSKRQYTCDIEGCSAEFSLAHQLKRHKESIRTHSIKESTNIPKKPIKPIEKQKPPIIVSKISKDDKEAVTLCKSTSAMRYTCPHSDCGRSYTSKSGLNVHIRAFHDRTNIFECTCGKKFSFKCSLLKHQERCTASAHNLEDR